MRPVPQMTPGEEVVLVRYAEIFLKGGNRAFFEKRLVETARRAASQLPGARIERLHGRLLARPGELGTSRLIAALGRVFGIASLSAARIVPREVDAITEAAIELARAEAARRGGQPTFKVESRRSDKRFLPTSPELSRLVGGAIVEALGLPVDVRAPMFTVGIEIGFDGAFVYAETIAGPGGLPTGSSGKVELLLSGGIDSPVAGWLIQKRGCVLGATYFHSPPYTGEKTKDKVVTLARKLAAWQHGDLRLSVVPFTDVQKQLREAAGGRLAVVAYRRMMMRIAERIARAAGAKALVTGEALGQVASQTLENLGVIGEAATMQILRPCVGHDKQETIALARRIDTYETSILPFEDCCSLFVPDHPETRAELAAAQAADAKLDVDALADKCAAAAETILCRESD